MAEDQDLWLRITRFGPAVLLPGVVLENRVHPGQWRPSGVGLVEEQIRRDFVETLEGPDRVVAESLFVTRATCSQANDAYCARRFSRALRLYLAGSGQAPELAASPLFGPYLRRMIVKCVLGMAAGRHLFGAAAKVYAAVSNARARIWPIANL